jgi:prophage regulatory protein
VAKPEYSGARQRASHMPRQAKTAPLTILRRKQVEARIGISRSAIYSKFRPNPNRPGDYDPTFPKPIAIGRKSVGWIEAEVDTWLAAQVAKSRPVAAKPKTKARPLSLPAAVPVLDPEA